MSNKQKTNKSAARRFKVTKSGKVTHRSPLRHLISNKSKSQLRRLKVTKTIPGDMGKKIRQMLGKQ
jgi:large subunit ribosomal protein L35